MEQFRDTAKTQRQASPIQDLIASFRHDHMHMENGVLVEDAVPDVAGLDIDFAPNLGHTALKPMRVEE